MVSIFLVVMLVISASFVTGIRLDLIEIDGESYPEKIPIESKFLGAAGWHDEVSIIQDGDELTDIYKTGNGGWEYPYDGNCVHMWATEQNGVATTTAEYTFDVGDGPVNYVKYEINYRDVGLFSDGPDAKIYKWDGTWDIKSNIGGAGNHHRLYHESP